MDKIVEKIKNLKNAFSLWTDKHLGVVKKYFLKFFINKGSFQSFSLKICFITCFQRF